MWHCEERDAHLDVSVDETSARSVRESRGLAGIGNFMCGLRSKYDDIGWGWDCLLFSPFRSLLFSSSCRRNVGKTLVGEKR